VPRADKAEATLDALNTHPFGESESADREVLATALRERNYRVIAKAAEIAGERLCYPVVKDLIGAYQRLLSDPVRKDPHCIGKQAVARALVALECNDAGFFLAGLRYRQMEPVWGGSEDTAIDVRNSSAMGLVNSGYPRAIQELTALLNDSLARARQGAVRAIGCANPQSAEALLRFKLLVGDPEPEVLGDCFAALLAVSPEHCLDLIAGYISYGGGAASELAALALGESRLPEALKQLQQVWDSTPLSDEVRRAVLRAAALHRSDAAFDWLLSIVQEGGAAGAEAAIDALSTYKHNAKLTQRVREALAARGNDRLAAHFERAWG
jgi:HEAT repeat protein